MPDPITRRLRAIRRRRLAITPRRPAITRRRPGDHRLADRLRPARRRSKGPRPRRRIRKRAHSLLSSRTIEAANRAASNTVCVALTSAYHVVQRPPFQ
jgi:hypothetical protein